VTEQDATPARLYAASTPDAAVREAFTDGAFTVAVYGLGKMGLPLATVFGAVSGDVVGVDVDPGVVATVNAGGCPVTGEPGLDEQLAEQVDRDRLRATTDGTAAAEAARLHVVIVPTLVDDGQPDLSAVDAAVSTVADGLDPGDMVVVESTVPPRTCRDRLLPRLERESGHSLGEFGLAFCPERTMSGRALADIRGTHPKVVGGAGEESRRTARLVYSEVTTADVLPVEDATTAECVKVFEGLYRDVNIALANELATLQEDLGVDVTAAIETANTQPYCDIHDPGPGVGGHCIPYYPYFVTSQFETATPLLETARSVNDAMPAFTVDRVENCLVATGRSLADSTALVLGLTYRPGVDETRASPGVEVARRLGASAAETYAYDPVCTDPPPAGVRPLSLDEVTDPDVDAVVLTTPHEAFREVDWDAFGDAVVVDCHRMLDGDALEQRYYAIGRGEA
jgi:UDP-N-acetyl-D-mannosaminuronic acid dehydrogenase